MSSALAAQSGTAIFGTVTDPTGAVISNAVLTATNDATGVAEKVKSNSDGYYIFLDVTRPTMRLVEAELSSMTTRSFSPIAPSPAIRPPDQAAAS